MAGNAHANRHGHRLDCGFCKTALENLKKHINEMRPGVNRDGLVAQFRLVDLKK